MKIRLVHPGRRVLIFLFFIFQLIAGNELPAQTTVIFSDDFNTGTLDGDKWRRGTNAGNQSSVINNQLELRSQGSESGWILTRNKYKAQNTTVSVKVVQPGDDGDIGMSPNYNMANKRGIYGQKNWYRFYTSRPSHAGPYRLIVQWKKNNVIGGNLDATGNLVITPQSGVYLRLRFNNTNIYFDASFDGVNWVNTYTEVFGLPGYTLNTSFYYELAAYNTTANGVMIADDFEIRALDTQAPTISNVAASNITASTATTMWTTSEVSDSQVEYGLTTSYGISTPLDASLVTAHAVALAGLQANTLYHYRVKSKDAAGNLATTGDFTFTTLSSDVTPPIISNVAASNITISAATISWATNEAADSQVEYGLTTSYGISTPLDASLVTAHAVALAGLQANTLYHYRVKSKDAAGNLATSGDFTFTTLSSDVTPPIISNVAASNITISAATISWTTNEAADSQVEYGLTTSYGISTPLDASLVTAHAVALAGLQSNTLYHYCVKSKDAAGNLATSGDFTFNTASATAQFVDITASAGVAGIPQYGGHAIIFADVNGDERMDMYVTHTNFAPSESPHPFFDFDPRNPEAAFLVLPDELFINNGNNTFTETAAAAGVNDPGESHGAVFVDIDNDGDFDLFNGQRGPSGNRLYANNGNGTFTEVTASAGILPADRRTIGVMALDIENDGDMDLFSSNWGVGNEMYVNDGAGHFTVENRGVTAVDPDPNGTMSATAADVDNDGDMDIFMGKRIDVAGDASKLYINNGSGFFTDQAAGRGVAYTGHANGAVFVDLDWDGDLDMLLAVTGVDRSNPIIKLGVYRNQGNGTFVDETNLHNIPYDGFTLNAGDLDNDGDIDIFTYINSGTGQIWLNNGTGHFTQQTNAGFSHVANDARAATLADIDNDGDLDVAFTEINQPTSLYRNNLINGAVAQNYLQIKLTGANGRVGLFGSRFYLYEAGHLDEPAYLRGYQQLTSVLGTLSQNFPIVHFGVLSTKNYDLRVRLLDGNSIVRTNLTPGQRLNLQAAPDTQPPVISSVAAGGLTSSAATITWTTNEAADSQVEYGLTASYGVSTPLDPALVTSHAVSLSNLPANTTYHYRVKSRDAAGNPATSADFIFTTLAPGAIVFSDNFNTGTLDVNKWRKGTNAGNQSSVISNQLELRSQGVESGWVITKNAYAARQTIVQVKVAQPNSDGTLGMTPTFTLSSPNGIFDETNWYRFYTYGAPPYRLLVQWKKNGIENNFDVTGSLVITGAIYLRLRCDNASIHFEVSFGGATWTDAYSETFGLPGYTLDSPFYYELSGYNTNSNGVLIVDDFSITTFGSTPDTQPPVISQVAAQNLTTTSAQIVWQTDEASDSQVQYGLTTSYGISTPLDALLVASHAVSLSNLQSNMLYHYRVRSRDAAGNLATSSDATFATPATNAIRLYTPLEISLATTTTYNNPYLDISVTGVFTSPGGRVLRLNGFWDGAQNWIVRFAPDESGVWSYQTQSADAGLVRSGTFTAAANPAKRGFVRVSAARPYQFEYSDGTPCLLMGDTNWEAMSSGVGYEARFKPYVDLRSSQNFNAYHSIVVHSRYDYQSNEGGAPFAMFDPDNRNYDSLNPNFFKWVDKRVAYADSMGVTSILFFSWAYEIAKMSTPQYDRIAQYIVARYAAYNVFWVLAGDYHSSSVTAATYRQIGQAVANADPYDHPLTIHPSNDFSNRDFANDAWMSYVMHQIRDASEFIADSIRVDRIYNKPVVNGEYGYHQPFTVFPQHGIRSDANYTRTGGWSLFGAGGYFVAGFLHTFLDPDSHYPYDPGFDVLPTYWDLNDPLDMEAARQYSVFSQFFRNNTAWQNLAPHPEWVRDDQTELLATPGVEYVAYHSRGGRMRLQLPAGYFSLAWFDPIAGTLQPARIFEATGETVLLTPSDALDAAALLRPASAPALTNQGNVTNLQSAQLNIKQVRFTWQTPVAADSRIDLQKPNGSRIQFVDNRETTSHDLIVDGLSANVNYTVKIFSQTADGREWKSTPQNLVTAVVVMDDWREAESMPTKTAGRAEPPGWNLSANGYIATTLNFPQTGLYTFTIRTRGECRQSIWPNLLLELDGTQLMSRSINSAIYKEFIVSGQISAGSREVKIRFTNDGNDRQLIVDWLHVQFNGNTDTQAPIISNVAASNISNSSATINWNTNEASDSQVEYGLTTSYGASTPLSVTLVTSHSASLSGLNANTTYHYRVKSRDAAGNLATSGDFTFTTSSTPPPFDVTLEAENMPIKINGDARPPGWVIWENGYLAQTVNFSGSGLHHFTLRAMGNLAEGEWSQAELRIDQVPKAVITVSARGYTDFSAEFTVATGPREVVIAFINGYYNPPAYRNLYVDWLRIQNGSAGGSVVKSGLAAPAPVALPENFALQSFPNPFSAGGTATRIRFELPQAAEIEAKIFDINGHELCELASGARPAGSHEVIWNGRGRNGKDLSSGVYLVRLRYRTAENGAWSQLVQRVTIVK